MNIRIGLGLIALVSSFTACKRTDSDADSTDMLGSTTGAPDATLAGAGVAGTNAMQPSGGSNALPAAGGSDALGGAGMPSGGSGAGAAGGAGNGGTAGSNGGAGVNGGTGTHGNAGIGGTAGTNAGTGGQGNAGSGGSSAPPANTGEPCTNEGAQRCTGVGAQGRALCSGGYWTDTSACGSGQVCSNDIGSEGTCKAFAEVCRDHFGEAVCDLQGSMHFCSADGVDQGPQACQSWAYCAAGLPQRTCASCLPYEEYNCSGAELQRCSGDGLGFSYYDTCDSAALCKEDVGACTPNVCQPNRYTCQSDVLRQCNGDGSALSYVTTCDPGLCDSDNGNCRLCVPYSTYCDSNVAYTCNSTGRSAEGPGCSVGCVAGECVECFVDSDCNRCGSSCTADHHCVREPSDVPYHLACNNAGCGSSCGGFCDPYYDCEPLYVFKASANGKYISVDSSGHLIASASYASQATKFAMYAVDTSTSDIYLYAWESQRFVSSEAGSSAMIADRTSPGEWERYYTFPDGDSMTIWSIGSGKYVTAEDAGASPLIANRDTAGDWEQFEYEYASP